MDVRRLFIGAAIAAALGLLTGGVLRPDLTLQGGSTEMAVNPRPAVDDGAAMSIYPGPVPDYVIGRDWLPRNDAAISQALAEAPLPATEPTYDPSPIDYESAAVDAAAREPTAYPSEQGDILTGLSAESPPPSDDDRAPAPPDV